MQFFFKAPASGGGKMTRNARNDIHPHAFYTPPHPASHPSTKTFLLAHLSMFGTLHTTGILPPPRSQHCTSPCHENAEVTQRSLHKGKAFIVRADTFHKERCENVEFISSNLGNNNCFVGMFLNNQQPNKKQNPPLSVSLS